MAVMLLTWKVSAGQFTDLLFDPTGRTVIAIRNDSDVPVEVRPNWQVPHVKYDVLPKCSLVVRAPDTLMQVGAPTGDAWGELEVVSSDSGARPR